MDFSEKLIAHINELAPLAPAEEPLVLEKFHPKTLKKREFLLQKGDISHHMRYIAKGCMRNYYIGNDGKEHTLQFGIEGWWLNDLYSFLTQTPGNYFLEALEPTTLLQIHRQDLEELYRTVPAMERFFRLKIQGGYVALQERMTQAMHQTAEERYLQFCRKYRNIEQRIPQYMLASYLGITPEFLSALRKKMASSLLS